MRLTPVVPLGITVVLLTSCGGGDSSGPSERPDPTDAPPLETVDYARLGTGKLGFNRISFGTDSYIALYIVDADARASTASLGGLGISSPALSPDGRRVAFTKLDFPTFLDVYVANVDGSSMQRVSNFPGQDGPPTWTPDGSQILFLARESNSSEQRVYRQSPIANPADRTSVAVENVPVEGGAPCDFVSTGDNGVIAVSVHGRLAFSCGVSAIYVMDRDGKNGAVVARAPAITAERSYQVYARAWSPDGRRVAYLEVARSLPSLTLETVSVRVIDVAERTVTTLATVSGGGSTSVGGANEIEFSLCWSAAGGWLAFSVPEADLRAHVYVVDADGTRLTRFTSAPDAYDLAVSCAR